MKEWARDLVKLAVGCILYAVSAVLINPVDIVPGSVLGVSVIVHDLWGTPIRLVNLICNAPIMVLCTMCFGKRILIYST